MSFGQGYFSLKRLDNAISCFYLISVLNITLQNIRFKQNILAIIGNDNLFIAFLGSPVIISIFSFFSIISLTLAYAIIYLYMQVCLFKCDVKILS